MHHALPFGRNLRRPCICLPPGHQTDLHDPVRKSDMIVLRPLGKDSGTFQPCNHLQHKAPMPAFRPLARNATALCPVALCMGQLMVRGHPRKCCYQQRLLQTPEDFGHYLLPSMYRNCHELWQPRISRTICKWLPRPPTSNHLSKLRARSKSTKIWTCKPCDSRIQNKPCLGCHPSSSDMLSQSGRCASNLHHLRPLHNAESGKTSATLHRPIAEAIRHHQWFGSMLPYIPSQAEIR